MIWLQKCHRLQAFVRILEVTTIYQKRILVSFAGLSWDGIDFLHRSWYGCLFWISAGNSVDTSVFSLLLSIACMTTHNFSHFYSFDSLAIPLGVSEQLCGALLLAWFKP